MGSRARAAEFRKELERALNDGGSVVLDFEGVDATQSFVDELIGVVVLSRGPEILERVSFRKCSPDMKAIISFVLGDRSRQHAATRKSREPAYA
jgi:hypothetical protein